MRQFLLSSFIALFSLIATQVNATDCDFESFFSLVGSVNLTVKARAIKGNKDFDNYVITKRYYGFELRDTIQVKIERIWPVMEGYYDASTFTLGKEVLLNLYVQDEYYYFGTCGQYEILIENDSIETFYEPKEGVSAFEQRMKERYGNFVQQPYRMIAYGDQQYMEPQQNGPNRGEFKLKTTLPDGDYFVYQPNENGFAIVEEVYLQQQHYIGRYKSWYGNGKRRMAICYNMQGILDGDYLTFYNNEQNSRHISTEYKDGKIYSYFWPHYYEYWPNGASHIRYEYEEDLKKVHIYNEKEQCEFQGTEVNGKLIGGHNIYDADGNLFEQYYTDERGKQGLFIRYHPGTRLVELYPYRNDTLQGKGYYVDWAKSPPLLFYQGDIISGTSYKILKEMNFKDGLLDGPQLRYFSKKKTQIEYYEMGSYIRCEGCFEF